MTNATSKVTTMEKTIKAKFSNGVIRPLEVLDVEEGKELIITVKELSPEDRFEKAMGSWRNTIDCDQLIKDIYESRRFSAQRPEVKL